MSSKTINERCHYCQTPLIAFPWTGGMWLKTCQTPSCENVHRPLGAYKCVVCDSSNGELNVIDGICQACRALALKEKKL